jgi:RNA-binding motif X-linked protein 2
MLRVDHVEQYKVPKYREDVDEETRKIWLEGCAPKPINAIIVDPADNDDVEDYRPRAKLDEFGLVPLDESGIDSELKAKIHEERKKEKRAKKLAKREAKRRRHEAAAGADNPQIADFDPTSGKKKPKFVLHDEKRDLGRSWKEQRKDVSDTPLPDGGANDDEFYGSNPHFNFSKDRKELPPAPTHNLRPDFEKAAWRDIEMWKMVRERERAARGEEKPTNWKEEEHYLPSRFRRE